MIFKELGFFEQALVEEKVKIIGIAHINNYKFNHESIKKALHRVIDIHPSLRINVDTSVETFVFREIKNKYIEPKIIISDNEKEWENYAYKCMNTPFDYDTQDSLFRFTLIENKDSNHLIFEIDHSVSDGVSYPILSDNLLRIYCQLTKGEELNLPPRQITPHLEEKCFPKQDSEEMKQMEDKVKQVKIEIDNFNKNSITYVKYNPVVSDEDKFNYPLYASGKKENLAKIKLFCKKHKITVGSLIFGATYFNILKYSKIKLIKDKDFKVDLDFDLDLRPRFPQPVQLEDIAMYVSYSNLEIDVNLNSTLVDISRLTGEKLMDILEKKTPIIEMLSEIKDFQNESLEKKKKITNFCVSNVGRYPFEHVFNAKDGEFRINNFHGIGSPWVPGNSHYIMVTQSCEVMAYSFVYYNKYNLEYAQELMDGIVNLVENIAEIENLTLNDYINIKK